MSNTITIPLKAYLKVPRPVDDEGNPLPATYRVTAEIRPSLSSHPERAEYLRDEFAQRTAAFAVMLQQRGDLQLETKLEAVREFVEFILTPGDKKPEAV